MTFRTLSIAAVALSCLLDVAHAAPAYSPDMREKPGPSADAGMAAYRQYVKAQADTLVGMTKVLARAIEQNDLEAAQMAYAPAHRYLERIEPIAAAMHDLNASMDARADAHPKKEADPQFSGFHRLEYGLFANKSTVGLSDIARRLDTDARALRDRLASLDPTPIALVDGTIRMLEAIAEKRLDGDEERYSKTDLWDLEANVDGARQVVALLRTQPQMRNMTILASTSTRFAKLDALVESHKAGCGFKDFDELTLADRTALKAPIVALAADLSALRGTLAMD